MDLRQGKMKACSFDILISSAGKENIPITALFELTHRCNLRCTHCYLHDYSGKGELTTAEWIRCIEEYAALGGLFLSFTGGEIFLRKDLFELCEFARSQGFVLKLLTNALLINRGSLEMLERVWPSEIHVSVYAAEPAIHDEVTMMKGSWEKTVGNCRKMREIGLSVVLKMPVMSINLYQIPKMEELAASMGASLRVDTDIMPKNDCSKSPLVHRMSDRELEVLFRMPYMKGRIPPLDAKPSGLDSDLCGAARRTFAITPTGDVQPCLANPVFAGNVRDNSVGDIWNYSPLMLRYRGLTVADLTPECIKCEHRAYCGRCSSMASLEDGDYLGKSHWACRVSEVRKRVAEARARGEEVPDSSRNKGFQFLGELTVKQ